ncbi:hypothetical protein [Pendulispora albinea]|uniref:Transposase n=1 Tax=Pendulispora albinea TaxID=2741071 RepID=A0ABZ2M213_9BACT
MHERKMPPGRPTMLNKRITAIVYKTIAGGSTMRHAADMAGVHYDTMKLWLRRGAEGAEPYLSFLTQTRKAEAVAEARAQRAIRAGIKRGTPEAVGRAKVAGWWLERRRWRDWWLARPRRTRDPSSLSDAELLEALVAELRKMTAKEPALIDQVIQRLKGSEA